MANISINDLLNQLSNIEQSKTAPLYWESYHSIIKHLIDKNDLKSSILLKCIVIEGGEIEIRAVKEKKKNWTLELYSVYSNISTLFYRFPMTFDSLEKLEEYLSKIDTLVPSKKVDDSKTLYNIAYNNTSPLIINQCVLNGKKYFVGVLKHPYNGKYDIVLIQQRSPAYAVVAQNNNLTSISEAISYFRSKSIDKHKFKNILT